MQISRLTGITYQMGPMLLGNLSYAYDQLGRQVQVGGSFARTGLPGAISSATYDAANQVTNWNGTPLSYDANGNMTSDGASIFTWNARGQLAAMSGGVNAAFVYDAFGRRIGKSINRNTLGFAYDVGGLVQEFSGDKIGANLWNGGTNYFQRTDASGSAAPITDDLGSVLARVDANGAIRTQYTYDPFGNTTISGTPNSNATQYIGQENDDTGLYYFHARYYSPKLQRFISEDPIGFNGRSVNLHSYSHNSPINFKDPGGKSPCVVGALAGSVVFNSYVIYETLNGRKINTYAGLSGLWNLAKGNAEAATTGCMIADGVASAYGALTEAGEVGEGLEALEEACCFVGGSEVRTKRGEVAIERIRVGEEVLSRNRTTAKLEYKKVATLTKPHQDWLLEMHIEGEEQPLRPTPQHPFWVRRGSAKNGTWTSAGQMRAGDQVLTTKETWKKLLAVAPYGTLQTVYNFEVEQNHDYYVGASGLLVHNGPACDIARKAAQGFENGDCLNCAKNIEKALEEAGESGERISIDTGNAEHNGNIYSDIAKDNISTNGIPEAVEVEGKVFDNITPNGVPKAEWIDSLHAVVGNIINFIK